jgi:hypothetical protein
MSHYLPGRHVYDSHFGAVLDIDKHSAPPIRNGGLELAANANLANGGSSNWIDERNGSILAVHHKNRSAEGLEKGAVRFLPRHGFRDDLTRQSVEQVTLWLSPFVLSTRLPANGTTACTRFPATT